MPASDRVGWSEGASRRWVKRGSAARAVRRWARRRVRMAVEPCRAVICSTMLAWSLGLTRSSARCRATAGWWPALAASTRAMLRKAEGRRGDGQQRVGGRWLRRGGWRGCRGQPGRRVGRREGRRWCCPSQPPRGRVEVGGGEEGRDGDEGSEAGGGGRGAREWLLWGAQRMAWVE